MATILKNDKRTINAWAMFDWANSSYALVIATAIFPPYFIASTPDIIDFGSFTLTNSAMYSYAVSFSYLLIAILSPMLSGIADYTGKRKFFLKLFTILGSISCMALWFFAGEDQLWIGTSAFILATIGFAGSIVFYNSYLPIIVTEDRMDNVSAKGFAAGYIGSVLLLIIILTMVLAPDFYGITDSRLPARLGFVMVGLWWLGFAIYTFIYLPKDQKIISEENIINKGFQEIKGVWNELKKTPNIRKFLSAFFFYSAGVQTVIYLATVFAEKILGFESADMITTVLILQLVAIGGAYLFAWMSDQVGNKKALITMVIIWILICVAAHFVYGKITFYVIAAFVGLVMGGIQSLSRSTYSKMINEKTDEATSYFSFYDVLYKLSLVFGTLAFGIVDNITGNMRYSVLVLALFFVAGLVLLKMTNFEKAFEN